MASEKHNMLVLRYGINVSLGNRHQYYLATNSYFKRCLWKFFFRGNKRRWLKHEDVKLLLDLKNIRWRIIDRYGFWRKLLKIDDRTKALNVLRDEIAPYLIVKKLAPRSRLEGNR